MIKNEYEDYPEEQEDWRPPIVFYDDEDDEQAEAEEACPAAENEMRIEVPETAEEAAEEDQAAEAEKKREDRRVRCRCGEKKMTSIGGQALIEGVMMRGPQKTVMAVRSPEGDIVIEEVGGGSAKKSFVKKIPLVRGVVSFIESMSLGMKTLMRSAEIAGVEDEEPKKKSGEQDEKDKGKKEKKEKKESALFGFAMSIASVLGIALAIVLFFFVPAKLYEGVRWLVERYAGDSAAYSVIFGETSAYRDVIRSAFEGIFKILVFIVYIAAVSKMPDIRRVFEYHGAEHKTIFCYEAGEELTPENVRKFKRFHPRCGTSFLIIMLVLGIIVGMFIKSDIALLRVGIRLACIPLIMGIGYELLKFCGRHDNILTRIIAAPGMWMQRLTTKEPNDSQIECAIESLLEVIPENAEDDKW